MSRENFFFALPVDGSFLLELPALPANFRRYHPDDVHITLCFLGPCGERAASMSLAALDAEASALARAPIEVRLANVVPMGPPRAYSALSALLREGRAETEALMGSLRDLLSDAAGVRREQRAPKAHVTVARPSRRASFVDRRRGLEWASACDLSTVAQRLDRVRLYRWSEDRRERLFRVAAERSFSPP